MEAFGRGLVSEPYLSTIVIGAALIERCGSRAQKQEMLPKIAEGALTLAFAHSERAARFDLTHVDDNSERDGGRLAARRQQDRGHRRQPPTQLIVSAHLR